MKAFSKDGKFLWGKEVLPFHVIHGMKTLQNGECNTIPCNSGVTESKLAESGSKSSSTILLVFGQKAFKVLELVKDETMRLEHAHEAVDLADWLLDVTWLCWKNPMNYEVVAITAHNILIEYKLVEGKVAAAQYRSEVSCILYPE